MATNNMPFNNYRTAATNYAAGLAAPSARTAASFRARLAGYLTPEQIASNVSGLYDPALREAGMLGERVSSAITGTTQNVIQGLSNLPGLDPNVAGLSARAAGRASGSAQLAGQAQTRAIELARALAISQAQERSRLEQAGLEEQALSKEEESARIAADIMPYAQAMSGMETERLNRSMIRAQLKNVPIQRRGMQLQNMLARGEITMQALQGAALQQELRKLGVSQKTIDNILKGGGENTQTNPPAYTSA